MPGLIEAGTSLKPSTRTSSGDDAQGRSILRGVINAGASNEQLAADLQKLSKRLHRMLGANGNPCMASFFVAIDAVQTRLVIRLKVRAA